DGDGDHQKVRHDEEEEDRNQDLDALLDPAQVQEDEEAQDQQFEYEPLMVPARGEEAEDLVDARRDGGRDRQDVVEDQSASGDDAEARAEQLRRDEVAAAAAREKLDDLAVTGGDDQDRGRDHQREEDREVPVVAQRLEGLLGAVRR